MEDKLSRKEFHIDSNTKDVFPPHLSTVELLTGVKGGHLHQGTFKASRDNFLEGFVTVDPFTDSVSIKNYIICTQYVSLLYNSIFHNFFKKKEKCDFQIATKKKRNKN